MKASPLLKLLLSALFAANVVLAGFFVDPADNAPADKSSGTDPNLPKRGNPDPKNSAPAFVGILHPRATPVADIDPAQDSSAGDDLEKRANADPKYTAPGFVGILHPRATPVADIDPAQDSSAGDDFEKRANADPKYTAPGFVGILHPRAGPEASEVPHGPRKNDD